MKLRMGQPKYGSVWGGFLLLFFLLGYLGYPELSKLAMAGSATAYLVGMIAERREHEAKQRGEPGAALHV